MSRKRAAVTTAQRKRYNETSRLYNERVRREEPKRSLLWKARWRAKQSGIPFSLTLDDIPEFPKLCPVFGIKMRRGIKKPCPNSPSIDRIVPALGYVPGNVRIISRRANMIKNDATLPELRKIVRYIEKHTQLKHSTNHNKNTSNASKKSSRAKTARRT